METDDPKVPDGFVRAVVKGSPTHHLIVPGGTFTLCARVDCWPVRHEGPKPMCRRCTIEAARLIRERNEA